MSAPSQPTVFGALLRQHRFAVGLSQEELADRAGLSADAVAALERGRRQAPRPLTVRMLAEALELDNARRIQFIASSRDQSATGANHRPPLPPDELIGRSDEVSAAATILTGGSTRLLTLTGPGGIGKTRLALAVAQAIGDQFPDQCWVPLEALPAGADVTATVGNALGVSPALGDGNGSSIAAHAGLRRLLLVLDNCEHVLDSCSALCAQLLPRCPNLHVVTTSRERLNVPGEIVHHVPPLDVPQADADPGETQKSTAVQLFLARAPHQIRPESLADISRVCRQLDGLALAIELAAARTNVLTVAQISEQLEQSRAILTTQRRATPARQQALDTTIAWSYDMLRGSEQWLFLAASAFNGGWTLPAIQHVAALPETADILELTGRLADKSLILVQHDKPEARYDMYTVIRQFASRRLDDNGRRAEVDRRFVDYFVGLAERADAGLHGPQQVSWLDLLDSELGNLRHAMALAARYSWVGDALRLSAALCQYSYLRGRYTEGRRWLDTALDLADDSDRSPARAKALAGSGYLAFLQCEYDVATVLMTEALDLHRELGDQSGAALVLRNLASVARERADYDRALALHEESLMLYESSNDASGMAWARHHLAFVGWLRTDYEAATPQAQAAMESFQKLGDHEGIVWSLIDLGVVARYEGDLALAEALLQRALDHSRQFGYREGVAWSLNQLGVLAYLREQPERATHLLDESLAEHHELGDRWREASVLEALAAVAHQRNHDPYAAFLLGAADALRSEIGAPVPDCERPDRDRTADVVLATLGEDAFARSHAVGRSASAGSVADGYPPEHLPD